MMDDSVKSLKNDKNLTRRDFIKVAGAAGVGSIISPIDRLAYASNNSDAKASGPATFETRPFDKTGINISMLSLGGGQNFLSKQLLLSQALKMGVTCWDTSRMYIGGKSEKGIGKFFQQTSPGSKKSFSHLQIRQIRS